MNNYIMLQWKFTECKKQLNNIEWLEVKGKRDDARNKEKSKKISVILQPHSCFVVIMITANKCRIKPRVLFVNLCRYIHDLESTDDGYFVEWLSIAAEEAWLTLARLIFRPYVLVVGMKPLWEQERQWIDWIQLWAVHTVVTGQA